MNEKNGTILVVDDEPGIRQLLRILLRNKGFEVIEAANGRDAVAAAERYPELDLILMDIMMPELSGLDACRRIRVYSKAPVLFLTARNTERDKEMAYENRYRVYGGVETGDAPWGNAADALVVDVRARRVKKHDQEIKLTDKEMELFLFLMKHRGEIMDVKTLYEAVWQSKYMPSSDNNIMVYIQRLRKKLEDDPANPVLIRTIYGRGYQID